MCAVRWIPMQQCGGKWAPRAHSLWLRIEPSRQAPPKACNSALPARPPPPPGERLQRGLAHTYAYSAMETAPKGRNPQIYYRSQTPLSKCINKFWWPNFIGSFWTGHPERLSWNARALSHKRRESFESAPAKPLAWLSRIICFTMGFEPKVNK